MLQTKNDQLLLRMMDPKMFVSSLASWTSDCRYPSSSGSSPVFNSRSQYPLSFASLRHILILIRKSFKDTEGNELGYFDSEPVATSVYVPLPRSSVDILSLDTGEVLPGKPFTVTAVVVNTGSVKIEDLEILICSGGNEFSIDHPTQYIGAIEPGETATVTFECNAMKLMGRNLAACGNPQQARAYKLDLRRGLKGLSNRGYHFDLVFLDPPYGRGLSQRCLEQLGTGKLLNPAATVVCEHAIDENLTSTYGCLQHQTRRNYGTTAVSFYRRGE